MVPDPVVGETATPAAASKPVVTALARVAAVTATLGATLRPAATVRVLAAVVTAGAAVV